MSARAASWVTIKRKHTHTHTQTSPPKKEELTHADLVQPAQFRVDDEGVLPGVDEDAAQRAEGRRAAGDGVPHMGISDYAFLLFVPNPK